MSGGMPRSLSWNSARRLSRIRSTHFSPCTVEVVETRTSSGTPSTVDLDLAVLRAAALDDVHVRHDLDAADERGPHARRAAWSTSCSAPSTRFRIRTRSSIGSMCTSDARSLHRLREQQVHDLDDRRVLVELAG